VRRIGMDEVQEFVRVVRLADDVDALIDQQAHDAFAGQQRVVGNYDAHGISARSLLPTTSTVPPTAPTRSVNPTTRRSDGVGPPVSMSTKRRAPTSAMQTAKCVAPLATASSIDSATTL